MFVRVSFPDPLRAQQIRTRDPFTVSICECHGARARMPDAHHRSFVARTGRLSGLRMSFPAALSLPARTHRTSRVIERSSCNPTVQVGERLTRGSGRKMVKRMSATLYETRKLAPATAGRWFASLNKSNDEAPLHVRFASLDFSVSAWWQVRHGPVASPSRHLRCSQARLAPSCRHGSARGLAGLISLPPLHSAALQLRKLRFRSAAFRSRQI
jgi:hypothetical protein